MPALEHYISGTDRPSIENIMAGLLTFTHVYGTGAIYVAITSKAQCLGPTINPTRMFPSRWFEETPDPKQTYLLFDTDQPVSLVEIESRNARRAYRIVVDGSTGSSHFWWHRDAACAGPHLEILEIAVYYSCNANNLFTLSKRYLDEFFSSESPIGGRLTSRHRPSDVEVSIDDCFITRTPPPAPLPPVSPVMSVPVVPRAGTVSNAATISFRDFCNDIPFIRSIE